MSRLIKTKVYAGRLKDRAELIQSSSGGAFTAISDYFLENGNAICATVYDYNTDRPVFRLLNTFEGRNDARGSKYIQSSPGDIFKEAYEWVKNNPDKKLMFIGTGCQADGFRIYSEMKGIRDRVFIVDLICHGTSSPKLWREYIREVEKEYGPVEYITFKDKRNGWQNPTAVAVTDKHEVLMNDYVNIFYNRCALRPSCHRCPYATTERQTDMTIGDFWHIENTIPDFFDPDGTSLFLIHTKEGKLLFDQIKENLNYRESNTKECEQDNLARPTPVSPNRKKFWNDYRKHGINYIMKKYGQLSYTQRAINKLKRIAPKLNRGGHTLTNSAESLLLEAA